MAIGEKEPRPGAWTRSLHPNVEFQLRKPPVWPRLFNSNCRIYTVTGGLQYCDHLGSVPEGSVRWYAQQAWAHKPGGRCCTVPITTCCPKWSQYCSPPMTIYIRQLELKNLGHTGGLHNWNSALGCRLRVQAPGRGSFSPVVTFKLCS